MALSSDKAAVLMGRMRQPSLSMHGIQGAFSEVGAKTVIPAKVGGKFSIRYFHSPLHLTPHADSSSLCFVVPLHLCPYDIYVLLPDSCPRKRRR